jgi:folate-dependent phosphoribosylglycinamide formyltransferase PurN
VEKGASRPAGDAPRLGVLISGRGSNLAAIIEAIAATPLVTRTIARSSTR